MSLCLPHKRLRQFVLCSRVYVRYQELQGARLTGTSGFGILELFSVADLEAFVETSIVRPVDAQ